MPDHPGDAAVERSASTQVMAGSTNRQDATPGLVRIGSRFKGDRETLKGLSPVPAAPVGKVDSQSRASWSFLGRRLTVRRRASAGAGARCRQTRPRRKPAFHRPAGRESEPVLQSSLDHVQAVHQIAMHRRNRSGLPNLACDNGRSRPCKAGRIRRSRPSAAMARSARERIACSTRQASTLTYDARRFRPSSDASRCRCPQASSTVLSRLRNTGASPI